ncbi:hypothetical protein Dvar_36190 [Desulfosarcina variabilis str. Montpellier]
MHRGYFALWRKIEDHPFYTEPREFSKLEAWLDILMQAQHDLEPQRVVFGMKVLTCHYGECLKTIKTWSDRWRWSRAKVFRYLKLLKKMEQIDFKSETVTTRILVKNYSIYDPRRNAGETEVKRERNARETRVNTDNNDKNVKNTREGGLKRAKQIPSDFILSESMKQYALSKGIPTHQIESIFEQFVNHHKARGSVMKDWAAAWRTWCLNEQKFGKVKGRVVDGSVKSHTVPKCQNCGMQADNVVTGAECPFCGRRA